MGDERSPSERFTGRVESYRRFRPRYPMELVTLLKARCGLTASSTIADIGAGTGLLAEIFLKHGNPVIAVEPNAEMRRACAELERKYPKLKCVNGRAESLPLADGAVDCVTIGQALHWFDRERARTEFARILRPGGYAVIVFNERRMSGDPFHEGYESLLLEFGVDYTTVQRQHVTADVIRAFFSPCAVHRAVLPNEQLLDLPALRGRIVSSSYMPQPGQRRYSEMMTAIEELFDAHAVNGRVRLDCPCGVSFGHLC